MKPQQNIPQSDSKAAISVQQLCKTYHTPKGGTKEALKGISLTIPQGSFFGLLGPNGAGKSTFINILAGLVNKTSGTVVVHGHDLDANPRAVRSSLGVVPQEVVIDPFFNVEETLEFYAGYFGLRPAQRRTEELLKALSLWEKRHQNARRLSGGMKRRVLIAKALVHRPPILILDEPTAGVDVELRTQLWEYVKELNRQGTTILLTTHYLEEAQELCDEIAIINHGAIVAHDSKTALMQSLDHKQVTLRLAQPMAEIPAGLAPFQPVLKEDGALVLRFRTSETSIMQVLNAVQNSGVQVVDLSTQEPDLEDVFRHVVRG